MSRKSPLTRNERQKVRYARYKKAGVCVSCGVAPPCVRHVRCIKCHNDRLDAQWAKAHPEAVV